MKMSSGIRARRATPLTLAALLCSLMSAAHVHAQQQYPALQQPEEVTTDVRGKIVSYDPQNATLVITTEDGKQLTLATDQRTEIISPPDTGSDVTVTYVEANGKKIARTVVNPAAMLEMEHATNRIHLMPLVLLALFIVLIAVMLQQWNARRRKARREN
jgi:preprotein translocase subunit YajC